MVFSFGRRSDRAANSCQRKASMMVWPRTSAVEAEAFAQGIVDQLDAALVSSNSTPSIMLLKSACWRAWTGPRSRAACRRACSAMSRAGSARSALVAPQPPVLEPGGQQRAARSAKAPRTSVHGVSFFQKPVADAAHGVEEFGGVAQFVAQAAHVGVHGAGVNQCVVTPDVLQQLLAGLDAALALGQHGDQFELRQRSSPAACP